MYCMNTDVLGCGIGIMGTICIGVCKTLYNVHDDIFRVRTGVEGRLLNRLLEVQVRLYRIWGSGNFEACRAFIKMHTWIMVVVCI